jgi:cyanate lyase
MSSGPQGAATARSRLEFDRLPNPKGDRVRLAMSGKFPPHEHYGAEQGGPENGFKEE